VGSYKTCFFFITDKNGKNWKVKERAPLYFKRSFAMGTFAPTNRLLLDKKVLLQWEKPWELMAEKDESSNWLGREDSNHKNFINKLIYIIIYKFIKIGSP